MLTSCFFLSLALVALKKQKPIPSLRLHQARPPGRQGQPCPSRRPGARCQGRETWTEREREERNVFVLDSRRRHSRSTRKPTLASFASAALDFRSSLLSLAGVRCDVACLSEPARAREFQAAKRGTGMRITTEEFRRKARRRRLSLSRPLSSSSSFQPHPHPPFSVL